MNASEPKVIYEVLDTTSEEVYDTLGVFMSLHEATQAAESTDWRGEDNDGYFEITIRERPVGTLHGHNMGKCVAKFRWNEIWDEDADEPTWERIERGGAS